MNREQLAAAYLTWRNDFLTVAAFAEYCGLHEDEAKALISLGRDCFENPHPDA